jgi:hypothetical protein
LTRCLRDFRVNLEPSSKSSNEARVGSSWYKNPQFCPAQTPELIKVPRWI